MAYQRRTLCLTLCIQICMALNNPLNLTQDSIFNSKKNGLADYVQSSHFVPQTTEVGAAINGLCMKDCICADKNEAGNYTLMQCYRTLYASFPKNLSELWPSLEILSWPFNILTYLDPNMMPDLPNLTALHLQNNNIVSIAKGTFDKYTKLERLELSTNYFVSHDNHTSLQNVLCGLSETSISHLYLHRITHDQLITVNSSTFKCLENTSLTHLDFSYNHVLGFSDGLFSPIKTLEYLDLRDTAQSLRVNLKAFYNLTSLSSLLLQLNPIQEFPKFLDDNSTILPNLTKLCLDFGIFPHIAPDRLAGLDGVQILTLDWNKFGLKHLYKENFINLSNLKILSLAHNTFETVDEGAFNHPKLELLDLTGSTFTINPIPDNLLQNLPGLKTLRFSEIYSLYAGAKSLMSLLRNLTNLEHLELRNLNLEVVHVHLFQNNKELQTIDLSNNKISVIHPDLFANLNNLIELYLSDNRILSVTQSTFPPSLLRALSILDLSYNPFDCSCDHMYWFIEQWMKPPWNNHTMKKKLSIDKEANNYACSTPAKFQNKLLDSISLKDCLNSPLSLGFILVFAISIFISLLFLTLSLLYKYQWHFKYWCFNLKAKWIEQHPGEESDSINYVFDAFVSYCSSDIKWVKNNLLNFEKKTGLSFCLHERDWIAGTDIVDNIMNSIKQSRKIILVVSNAFARSQWCYFEMTMIQIELLQQDKDNVILIVKEEVDDVNMNPRLAWHLKTKTYIEWPYAKDNYQRTESLLTSYRLEASLSRHVTQDGRGDNRDETISLIQPHTLPANTLLSGNDIAEKLFWEKLEKAVLKQSTSIRTVSV